MPDEDKMLDDLLGPNKDEDGNEDTSLTPEEIKAMKEEMANLKKENHGLLTTVKKERSKRQNSDGKLEQLTATVNDIIARNKQGTGEPVKTPDADGIPVLYNDDGDPYLPSDGVNALLSKQQEEINQLKELLTATQSQSTAQAEAEKNKLAIVGRKAEYGPAYSKYQTARAWVEGKVNEFTADNPQYKGQMIPSGWALDNIFTAAEREEFTNTFPDVDLMSVVTAEDSYAHFEMMLDKLAPSQQTDTTPVKQTPDSRFQQVLNKPSSLGKMANAKTEPSIIDKAGGLSSTSIIDLTDAQVAALERAMLQEESNEGIKFRS